MTVVVLMDGDEVFGAICDQVAEEVFVIQVRPKPDDERIFQIGRSIWSVAFYEKDPECCEKRVERIRSAMKDRTMTRRMLAFLSGHPRR